MKQNWSALPKLVNGFHIGQTKKFDRSLRLRIDSSALVRAKINSSLKFNIKPIRQQIRLVAFYELVEGLSKARMWLAMLAFVYTRSIISA